MIAAPAPTAFVPPSVVEAEIAAFSATLRAVVQMKRILPHAVGQRLIETFTDILDKLAERMIAGDLQAIAINGGALHLDLSHDETLLFAALRAGDVDSVVRHLLIVPAPAVH